LISLLVKGLQQKNCRQQNKGMSQHLSCIFTISRTALHPAWLGTPADASAAADARIII
jgi:hypothetical protein